MKVRYVHKEDAIQTEAILVATGRRPRVRDMGLETAGVAFSDVEGITVDDNMRTTNANIFAAGDCCSRYQFTHMAGTCGHDSLPLVAVVWS